MTKFKPFKGCNCGWCKGSKQNLSRSRSKKYKAIRNNEQRAFRRTGKNIGIDYEMPYFVSTERWS